MLSKKICLERDLKHAICRIDVAEVLLEESELSLPYIEPNVNKMGEG